MKKDKTISFATAKEKFFVYGKNRKEGEIMENEMKNQEKQENELALKTENKSQRKKETIMQVENAQSVNQRGQEN